RFKREAQVLASLNHPNIAAIYGVEERALILELVEGPTLAERIGEGPVPVDEALPIARQIAEALEYAHEKGIVHRDLKPANVKVTPEGRVKVLDFGLAKALANESAASDPNASPTLTMRATVTGTIMGTAGYMSPEQARGQNADRRADIWAFGVVLYEMLSGRRLFGGPTVSDTLAAVLKGEIDWAAIPVQVRPVLERCLKRDPRQRWHCIGDAGAGLDGEGAPVAAMAPRRATPWMVAAVLAIAAAAGWWIAWRATRPVDRPLTRLSVDLGPETIAGFDITAAISPDGRRLVFPARGPDGKAQLATRLLDEAHASLLAGTDGGFDPFFSPDGQSAGFFADGQLKKISVQAGTPVVLCAAPSPRGGSWGDDGNIVAALTQLSPLSRVPPAGGAPQHVTKLGVGDTGHRWPQVLPGSQAVLFTASPTNTGSDDSSIEAVSLKTGQVKVLLRGGYYGRYVPPGWLVYVHQGALFGLRFDVDRLEVRGSPVPLVQDLAANPLTGGGQFDFSTAAPGNLVYLAGAGAAQSLQVAWLDSTGQMAPLATTPGTYSAPRFSPDGKKLALVTGADGYIHDLERDTTIPLTSKGHVVAPIWAPDGKHLVFVSVSDGSALTWIRSNGSGEPQVLLKSKYSVVPWSFSPDGRRLAYHEVSPETGGDLWTVPLDLTDADHPKAGTPELFLRTPAEELLPRFSPDGRWIAYRSNESGANEIYVRPFPAGSGGKWPISTGGGLYALWSKNGHELFYEAPDDRIMVVDYTVDGEAFVPGKPRVWSQRPLFYAGVSNLDLAPDGARFAIVTAPEMGVGSRGSVHVTLLENFFDELRRKAP
ncbi:MAG: protein kinase domain-containing protein, partial [Bryobacteraceae bacterium]